MRFSYTIRHQCAAFTPSCTATADFATVSTLPGGTVVANGSRISIAQPTIKIPVVGGTGLYKGASGTFDQPELDQAERLHPDAALTTHRENNL